MSSVVRFERRTLTLTSAVAAFLAQHDLSLSSRRVYTTALRSLKDGLGADVPLAMLDEPGTAARLANWFRERYELGTGDTRSPACHPAVRLRLLAGASLDRHRPYCRTRTAQSAARSHQGTDAREDRRAVATG
jgi:hypothetical protein